LEGMKKSHEKTFLKQTPLQVGGRGKLKGKGELGTCPKEFLILGFGAKERHGGKGGQRGSLKSHKSIWVGARTGGAKGTGKCLCLSIGGEAKRGKEPKRGPV